MQNKKQKRGYYKKNILEVKYLILVNSSMKSNSQGGWFKKFNICIQTTLSKNIYLKLPTNVIKFPLMDQLYWLSGRLLRWTSYPKGLFLLFFQEPCSPCLRSSFPHFRNWQNPTVQLVLSALPVRNLTFHLYETE